MQTQGRRLLVIATSEDRSVLTRFRLASFDVVLELNLLMGLTAVDRVLEAVELFPSTRDREHFVGVLRQAGIGTNRHLYIGIKRLLSVIETARQDHEAVAERLKSLLM